ncbi:MAG: ABC transporter permease [Acidobacteriota bacterium]
MNWEHLKTYIWVRWRLSANQVRRSGKLGIIIAAILTGLRIMGGAIMFIVGLVVGFFALNEAEPHVIMYVWDGATAGFIVFWMIGLMSELQRTELLSLNNFMHLPVSPSGAFLINYAGSSISLSLILFFPAMLGLSAGLTFSRGFAMFGLFPLVVSFTLMLTAVTYQFRGWLASMMTNPRRRRTIIAIISLAFILIFQLPNILTNFNPAFRERRETRREARREMAALGKELEEGKITQEEFDAQVQEKQALLASEKKRESEKTYETIRSVNAILPPGWLPYGAEGAAQGRFLPVAAGVLGMALIGAASLRRSYKTTIRMYMGDFSKGRIRRKDKAEAPRKDASKAPSTSAATGLFVEKKLPRVSEYASAVAFAGFRSLWRSTESKMMLLTPVIMLVVFGGIFAGGKGEIPGMLRPLSAIGFASGMLILGLTGFLGNMFAFDRNGFRSLVLSGVPRREILLGKNFSYMPFAFPLMALIICVIEFLYPMRPDHFIAALIQILPIYLLFCLAGNILSILSPLTLKHGSGMPAQHQGVRTLFQMIFMLIVPIPIGCTLIPLGIEALFSYAGWLKGFPIFLTLGIIQAVLVVWLYRKSLGSQGILMQQQEKKILEVVSQKGE